MIDKWFLEDIKHLISHRNRVVILDPNGQCEFLLKLLPRDFAVIKTDSKLSEQWQRVKEELFLRHETETRHQTDSVVFYVTREKKNLSFLLDYCFTHGCLDLSTPAEWLKKKLFDNTGLQVPMDSSLLLTAAKIGIGKDIAWWKKILQNLEELVTLDDELLPFLNSPETFLNSEEPDIRRLFEEKLFELLGQPYIAKPPKTLANEIVKRLFDGLVYNDVPAPLLEVYYHWVDSDRYKPSLEQYIAAYKMDSGANPWSAHPDHCFNVLDEKALQHLTANLRDKSFVSEKLRRITPRVKSTRAQAFLPSWWQDVFELLEFDGKALNTCNSFNHILEFYTHSFIKADRAIRHLYAAFLQEEAMIRPLQEYYESLNRELLAQWFSWVADYKSDQQCYLITLLKKASPGFVAIVGDGIRYEIADFVANSLEKQFKVERGIMLADLPSVTDRNMTALYTGSNAILSQHKDREKWLLDKTGKPISFMDLEAVHYGLRADYLVLTYKDIDSAGEKLQQGALKLFNEFEQVLTDKITLLLKMGYTEVHLLTDHGFVLTGLLDEADKIEPNVKGKAEVHERFLRTVEKQSNDEWIKIDSPSGEFRYVYVSKSHRPFKSKGKYGYSHGGFTPQEVVIPNFVFRKQESAIPGLKVTIINKKELLTVVGNLFVLKIQAASSAPNMFAVNRKVKTMIFSGSVNLACSNIISMEPGKVESLEFSFDGKSEVKAVLLDAETQEQLDSFSIKKSDVRDLGGLF